MHPPACWLSTERLGGGSVSLHNVSSNLCVRQGRYFPSNERVSPRPGWTFKVTRVYRKVQRIVGVG
jgi:hypothetical protein